MFQNQISGIKVLVPAAPVPAPSPVPVAGAAPVLVALGPVLGGRGPPVLLAALGFHGLGNGSLFSWPC